MDFIEKGGLVPYFSASIPKIINIPKGGTDKTDRRLLFLIAVIHEIRGNARLLPTADTRSMDVGGDTRPGGDISNHKKPRAMAGLNIQFSLLN